MMFIYILVYLCWYGINIITISLFVMGIIRFPEHRLVVLNIVT